MVARRRRPGRCRLPNGEGRRGWRLEGEGEVVAHLWGSGRMGAIHGGGGSSREDRRWEVVLVVVGSDLGAIDERGGGAELAVVNPGAEDGWSWRSLMRCP
jgi:hypothetical protein